jgi:hypothetical protein
LSSISSAIRINAAAPGLAVSVAASSAVTATLDSVAGVNSVVWRISSTDETTLPEDYTLVPSGIRGENVAFNALAVGTSGILEALINDGIDETRNVNPFLRGTCEFNVPTAGGLLVGCVNETFEGDATFGSTPKLNSAIRGIGDSSAVAWVVPGVKTADYTAAVGELVIVDATGGDVVVTLPSSVASNKGKRICVTLLPDAPGNSVNISPAVGQTLNGDGPPGFELTPFYLGAVVVSDGAGKWVYESLATRP